MLSEVLFTDHMASMAWLSASSIVALRWYSGRDFNPSGSSSTASGSPLSWVTDCFCPR